MENEEDLRELEVRLYSQVHHDAVEPEDTAAAENAADFAQSTCLVDSKEQSGNVVGNSNRYWAKRDKPLVSQHKKFVRSVPEICAEDSASASGPAAPSSETKLDDRSDAGATLPASGGGPEKKRSINPFSVANARKALRVKEAFQTNVKSGPGNFEDRKLRKLEQNKKIHQKRLKSRIARMKSKKTQETIVLESSDEDDGDVVVVPMPPPPIVTLESSDDGEDDDNREAFAKPSDPKQPGEQKVGACGSRCNSPNSVMSDDFIGQQDKTRLLSETNVPEDHELQCPISEQASTQGSEEVAGRTSHQAGSCATPTKRVSRATRQRQPSDYQVTQSNIGAVDVYESESSDMPESVYQKGDNKKSNAVFKSSGSDVEEVEAVAKTKRLRKRRASSSNKGSEPNDDSTDSEEGDNSATSIPYIARGEAIENCKWKTKRRTISNRDAINPDDREFIDKLSNIARGHGDTVADLDESHGSNHSAEADITARAIAEDVLKQASKESKGNDNENAIPSEAIEDLQLFQVIDTISTQLDDFKEPPRHGRDPTPELHFEDLTERNPLPLAESNVLVEKAQIAREKVVENKLNFMHVVHTNRDHVTWNEEMVRFYEHSWGQERFNVDRILRLMDRNADWHIISADRFPKSKKYTNLKCHNCCEFGHHRMKCPLPRKDLICFACGDIGHKEPRCPNAVCLRCGRKTNVFTRSCQNCIVENSKICPICKIRGHSIDLCPDKWRRYHSTTAINEHPNSQVFYNERKACCICGGRGHLPEHCRSSNKLNEYHAPTSEIRYHSKTYEDIKIKEPFFSGVVGVNLMCQPDETVTFPFSKKVTKHQYYGRFLAAVDLFDAPETKIVRNYVLNPFAKKLKREDKNNMKKEAKRKKIDKDDNIELNVSGDTAVPESMDDTQNVEASLDDNAMDVLGKGEAEHIEVGNTDEIVAGGKKEEGNKTSDIVALDTDSNYSFSEHFPSTEKNEDESILTLKVDRNKSVEQLPDFIPISGDLETGITKRERKVGPLPDFISLGDSDEDDIGVPLKREEKSVAEEGRSEESCEGKIYPSKFHSQFLLSPDGTKFLVEASRECNVKVIMDWSAIGNVLVIHGVPSNQDKFHTALMEKMKTVSDDKNRKTLEQSQKLPRARDNLIRVLQESILQLEKDLGDVIHLHKKMKFNEDRLSKSNFKLAEKYRRTLNMILMGQAGLRDGQMHLSNLQDKLRELTAFTNNEPVPLDLREQIEKHYRYIFSSYQHGCYDQLIRVYMNLKKTNNLPELKLDYKLLGKNVLDTSFTKEQMEKLMQPPQTPKVNQSVKREQSSESVKTPRTEFGLSPQKQFGHVRQKSVNQFESPPRHKQQAGQGPLFNKVNQFQNVPPPPPFYTQLPTTSNSPGYPHTQLNIMNQPMKPSHRQFQFNAGGRGGTGTFVANKIREINKKWDNETNNLLNQVSSTPMKAGMKPSKNSSCFWSRECLKFIARCMNIQGLQDSITEKLNQLSQRAAGNMLSFADFKAVKRIYFNLLKAEQKSLHGNR